MPNDIHRPLALQTVKQSVTGEIRARIRTHPIGRNSIQM